MFFLKIFLSQKDILLTISTKTVKLLLAIAYIKHELEKVTLERSVNIDGNRTKLCSQLKIFKAFQNHINFTYISWHDRRFLLLSAYFLLLSPWLSIVISILSIVITVAFYCYHRGFLLLSGSNLRLCKYYNQATETRRNWYNSEESFLVW